jgi:hypothetical protein
MSSDESETETTPSKGKQVRRVAKAWISKEVSDLWKDVEEVGRADINAAGNSALPRLHSAKATNVTSKPVSRLPINFYDKIWWASLHTKTKRQLKKSAKPEMRIPVSRILFWQASA